jgi:acyl-CoA reductase-like NAD-dependent aldehyde dehydrogenase
MSSDVTGTGVKRWTAAELRKLPPEKRDAILEAAAAQAEAEYRSNAELTDFEAFGKDDLYVESSNTETRLVCSPKTGPGGMRVSDAL